MNLTADQLALLEEDAHRIGVFFRLKVSPIVRLWLGIGHIAPGDVSDPDGAIYQGAGQLTGVPDFDQLLNAMAQRLEFFLSGVSAQVMALADESSDQVRDADVDLGIGIMDAKWQIVGPLVWLWRGYGDYLRFAQQAADGPDSITSRVVTLSAGSRLTERRRGRNSYLTDGDQKRRAPGDRFCERVTLYSNFTKPWPILNT